MATGKGGYCKSELPPKNPKNLFFQVLLVLLLILLFLLFLCYLSMVFSLTSNWSCVVTLSLNTASFPTEFRRKKGNNIFTISGLLHWIESSYFIVAFLYLPIHWRLFCLFLYSLFNRSMLWTAMLSPGRESSATLIYLLLGISGAGQWRLYWSAATACAGLLASPGSSLR